MWVYQTMAKSLSILLQNLLTENFLFILNIQIQRPHDLLLQVDRTDLSRIHPQSGKTTTAAAGEVPHWEAALSSFFAC